jgi:hypothetical protein
MVIAISAAQLRPVRRGSFAIRMALSLLLGPFDVCGIVSWRLQPNEREQRSDRGRRRTLGGAYVNRSLVNFSGRRVRNQLDIQATGRGRGVDASTVGWRTYRPVFEVSRETRRQRDPLVPTESCQERNTDSTVSCGTEARMTRLAGLRDPLVCFLHDAHNIFHWA